MPCPIPALVAAAALLALAACTSEPAAPAPDAPPAPASTAGGPVTPTVLRTDSLRIDVDSLRYRVRIGYPVLGGVPEAVNAALRDSVAALAESYRPDEAPPADARESWQTTVEGGTTVGLLRPDLVSAVVDVYAYTGGAHGMPAVLGLNVDPRTNTWVGFDDLVTDGPALRDTLAAFVTRAVLDRLVTNAGETPAGAQESIESYNDGPIRIEQTPIVSLVPDSLVVHVPPYDVMPYVVGPFRVPVPLSALGPLLKPDGPASRAEG